MGSWIMLCFGVLLMMSSLICMLSTSWFGVWIGLEMNLLCFMFLIGVGGMSWWGLRNEGVLGYFFIQVIGSLILLFFMLLGINFGGGVGLYFIEDLISVGVILSLLLKLGVGPFWLWFPYVTERLTWFSGLVLMTWQKLALFVVLGYFVSWGFMVGIMVMISVAVGSIGGFGEVNLKRLFSYSSVSHAGWLIGLIGVDSFVFYYYYFIYCFLVLVSVLVLLVYDFVSVSDFFGGGSWFLSAWWGFNLLSVGGLPPFVGFYASWLGLWYMMEYSFLLVGFLVLMALVSLYFYLRLVYVLFMGGSLVGYYSEGVSVYYGFLFLSMLSMTFCLYFPLVVIGF